MTDAATETVIMTADERKAHGLPFADNSQADKPVVAEKVGESTPVIGVPTTKLDPDPTMVISPDEANKIRGAIAKAQSRETPTEETKP